MPPQAAKMFALKLITEEIVAQKSTADEYKLCGQREIWKRIKKGCGIPRGVCATPFGDHNN